MMPIRTILFLLAIVVAASLAGYYLGPNSKSESDPVDDEIVMHYEGADFETADQARTALDENATKIESIIAQGELNDSALEQVHEISYTLEKAADKIRAEKTYASEEAMDYVEEAIQALHHASENHKADITLEWAGRLKVALANL